MIPQGVGPGTWVAILLGQSALLLALYPAVERRLGTLAGRWSLAVRYAFFAGTVIHELSHAVACFMMLVPVGRVALFSPRRQPSGGWLLGYVEHADGGAVRNAAIGVAPVFGCALATYAAFLWATGLPPLEPLSYQHLLPAVRELAAGPWDARTALLAYLVAACAISGTPSRMDLESVPLALAVLAFVGIVAYAAWSVAGREAMGLVAGWEAYAVLPLAVASGILGLELAVLAVALAVLLALGLAFRR